MGVHKLAQNDTSAGEPLKKVLVQLEDLKQTPIGTVIYDQIARIVQDHDNLQARLEHTYGTLLQLLLEAYAREPTAEQVTRLNARLIQWRQTQGEEHPPQALEDGRNAGRILGVALRAGAPGHEPEARREEGTGQPAHAGARIPPGEGGETAEAGTPAERRVNTAYRLHLDRKRDEIAKLQEALAQSVLEAIAQNREFGALLQIELQALQQAESAQEIENLRQILIGGIEELIQGQSLLDAKLHKTGDYLKLIKADSERLREELNKVRLLSLTDEFTGLPNRRAFLRRLQDEIGRAQRYGTPLALVLIDLDEFKAINDVHGHAAGDQVLRCYAREVLTILRHHDMVARYGGEEFAVLLPNTTQAGAVAAITKVRKRALEVICEFDGKTLALPTFSAGLTMYVPGDSAASLIGRADKALYRAKHLGRNCIEIAPNLDPEAAASPPQTNENEV